MTQDTSVAEAGPAVPSGREGAVRGSATALRPFGLRTSGLRTSGQGGHRR